MKINCTWNEGMRFKAEANGHSISMDAKRPIGTETALTPKELVLAAICGCTAMDVTGLMRKYRLTMSHFEVSAEASMTETHPVTFKEVNLVYSVKGEIDPAKLIEAVQLSQTKYCSVSAMISKAAPIHFRIHLDDKEIHSGSSNFG